MLGAGSLGKTVITKALDTGVGLPFSRTDEEEADLIGLELAAARGIDPLEEDERFEYRGVEAILSEHPPKRCRANDGARRRNPESDAFVPRSEILSGLRESIESRPSAGIFVYTPASARAISGVAQVLVME